MRCCPGGELFGFISECGPFDESRARGMMRQLLNALQHLQNLGIGNRDLSLENILFDETRELFVVIDFGMCKRCHLNAASAANPPPVFDASCYQPLARLSTCGKRNYIAPGIPFNSITPMVPLLSLFHSLRGARRRQLQPHAVRHVGSGYHPLHLPHWSASCGRGDGC